jgi:hypothetical protein
MAQGPYSFLSVFVGVKKTDARPVKWDRAMMPLAYETTCTKCSMLVKFAPSQIREKDGIAYVPCWHCKSVPPDKPEPAPAPSIVDPIEAGRLKIPGARRLA